MPTGARFISRTDMPAVRLIDLLFSRALGFLTKPDDEVKVQKETMSLSAVWSRRLLEIENIGDQVVGIGVSDYQIRHSLVI